MRTVEIVGVVTTRSHTMQTQEAVRGATKTRKTTVFTPEGQRREVPYISGSSVRGKIRRIAGDRVLRAVTSSNLVTRDLAMCVLRGSGGRTGIMRHLATPKVLASAATHPFVGVFAGGPMMFESNLSTHDFMPLIDWTRQLCHPRNRDYCLTVTRDAESNDAPAYVRLTTDVQFAARDDFRDGKCAGYVANHDAEFIEWVTRIARESAAKKADKAEGKRASEVAKTDDLRVFGTYEAMLPGTPLNLELRLEHPTEAQVGLVLDALTEWGNENKLGGGSARGLGRFVMSAALVIDGKVEIESLFSGDAPHYKLSDRAQPFREAAAAAVAQMTAEDLERYYPSSIGAADDGEE